CSARRCGAPEANIRIRTPCVKIHGRLRRTIADTPSGYRCRSRSSRRPMHQPAPGTTTSNRVNWGMERYAAASFQVSNTSMHATAPHRCHEETSLVKQTRRHLLGSMIAGGAAFGAARLASAQPAAQLPQVGDSSTGTMKAGPLGLTVSHQFRQTGQVPVAMICPEADVDAEVERTKIVDGQMLDPSGPWIIAWYEGTGL